MESLIEYEKAADVLRDLIRKLRSNEEKVGKDVLRQKYEEPYNRLRDNILKSVNILMNKIIWAGVLVLDDEDGRLFKSRLSSYIAQKKDVIRKMSDAVFIRYSLDEAMETAFALNKEIRELLYPRYIFSTCVEDKDGRVYSPVYDMVWDDNLGLWANREGTLFTAYPEFVQ